jgi:hypothetical protein
MTNKGYMQAIVSDGMRKLHEQGKPLVSAWEIYDEVWEANPNIEIEAIRNCLYHMVKTNEAQKDGYEPPRIPHLYRLV